jgi:hypothetical protein
MNQEAFNGVLARPDVTAAFRRVGERLAGNAAFSGAVSSVLEERLVEMAWAKKLKALNGGSVPDKERATQLLLDNALSEARFAEFYKRLVALPVVQRQVTEAARDIARTAAFQGALVVGVRECVNDAAFQDRALELMLAMVGEKVDKADFQAKLDKVVTTPLVAEHVIRLIDKMLTDPEIGAIGNRAVSAIAMDPAFKKAVADFCDAW